MIGILLATCLCLFCAWFFLLRPAGKVTSDADSASQRNPAQNQAKRTQNMNPDAGKGESNPSGSRETQTKGEKVPEKKSKTHADHKFFFKSFKYNDGVIQDVDFSQNAEWMLTCSQNRQHLLTNLKTESSLKFMTSKTTELSNLRHNPSRCMSFFERKVRRSTA